MRIFPTVDTPGGRGMSDYLLRHPSEQASFQGCSSWATCACCISAKAQIAALEAEVKKVKVFADEQSRWFLERAKQAEAEVERLKQRLTVLPESQGDVTHGGQIHYRALSIADLERLQTRLTEKEAD